MDSEKIVTRKFETLNWNLLPFPFIFGTLDVKSIEDVHISKTQTITASSSTTSPNHDLCISTTDFDSPTFTTTQEVANSSSFSSSSHEKEEYDENYIHEEDESSDGDKAFKSFDLKLIEENVEDVEIKVEDPICMEEKQEAKGFLFNTLKEKEKMIDSKI
ncbi:hypothetical protein RJT34_20189 [Clitoria ternatea]|uniref:Uncharacterized protein n=1 Tax=Clitoria ternatea TaxID=43366 RepID=A0AAN9ISL7_CLITE